MSKNILELDLRSSFDDTCKVLVGDGVDTKVVTGLELRSALRVRKVKLVELAGLGIFRVPASVTKLDLTVSPTAFYPMPDYLAELATSTTTNNIASVALLKSDGSAWMWGMNDLGQLGDGTTVSKSSPVAVIGGYSFVKVAHGNKSSMGLRADGSVLSWGDNSQGQLGDLTILPKSSPIAVIGGHSFIDVGIPGGTNAHAIKIDGSGYGWGINQTGQLADGTIVAKSSPVAVIGGHSFQKVNHHGALKFDGTFWTWGTNATGKLGDGTNVSASSPVAVIGGHSFIQITNTAGSNAALKADGTAWGMGTNSSGQLGDGTASNRSSPVQVIGGHSFVKLSGSATNSMLALKADGTVWGWGSNAQGQLGDGTIISRSSPVQVIGGHSFKEIYGGGFLCVALKEDGSAWTWGDNTNGQLGDGTTTFRSSPVAVIGGHSFARIRANSASLYDKKFTLWVTPGQEIAYSDTHFGPFCFSSPSIIAISYHAIEDT